LRSCWASRWRPAATSLDRCGRGPGTGQRHDRGGLYRARGLTRQCAAPTRQADRATGARPPAAEVSPGAHRPTTAGRPGSAARASLR
jgi:hypothetical protein